MYNPSNDYEPDREEIEQCERDKAELIELRDLLKNRYPGLTEKVYGNDYEEYKRCYNKLYSIVVDILKDTSDDTEGKLWSYTFSSRCDETKLNPDQVETLVMYIIDFDAFTYEVKNVVNELEQAMTVKENKAKHQEESARLAQQRELIKQAEEAKESNKIFDWKDNRVQGSSQMYMTDAFVPEDEL
jgi:hypothetical protein